jgi:predicted membrane-bound mannosyltransferase
VRDVTGSFDVTLRLLPVIAGVMIVLAALAPELSSARIDE